MKSKAIFLDIDGTILPSNQILSPKVKYAIEQARTNGHYVFLCTGRNYCNISSFSNVEFEGMVCSNGTLENLSPVFTPEQEAAKRRELEQQLYEVFRKYADKRQSEEAGA